MKLKLRKSNGLILSFVALTSGISIIAISIACADLPKELELLLLCVIVGAIGVIVSLVNIRLILKRIIVIDDECISSLDMCVLSKSIKLENLQRIVVYRVARWGGKIARIIFDDGSFCEYDDPQLIISGKLPRVTSFISIEYSKRKLKLLQKRFVNAKFEIIDRTFS